jgi:predicted nucleic acid binding AN1-type Zn finger protein
MDCKYCKGQFCMKCFRLEVHNCPGQEDKIKTDRENLSKDLTRRIDVLKCPSGLRGPT